jgi:hypothetical protein
MTGVLKSLVGCTGDQIGEAANFLGRDQQIDHRVQIGAPGRVHSLAMPIGAFGFRNKSHKIRVCILARVSLKLAPGNLDSFGSPTYCGQQIALQFCQF